MCGDDQARRRASGSPGRAVRRLGAGAPRGDRVDVAPIGGRAGARRADSGSNVSWRQLALAGACITLGRSLPAQDWHSRSVVGSAALWLDGFFERLHGEEFPLQTATGVNASYAP